MIPTKEAPPRRHRVLIVEDDQFQVALLKKAIEGGKIALDCEFATTIAQVLRRLEAHRFEAMLLDLGLEDCSGLDTLKKVLETAPDVPVVIYTATEDEATAIEALRVGAQDYLVKGQASGGEIQRAIRYAIERRYAQVRLAATETDLRDLDRRQNAILRSIPQALALVSADWNILWSNTQMAALVCGPDAPAAQCAGVPIGRIFRAGEFNMLMPEMRAAVRLKGIDRRELRLLRHDTTEFWAQVTMVKFDPEQSALGYVVSIDDISERKAQEEVAAKERAMLNSLIDLNPFAIMIADADGKPHYWNKASSRLWGADPLPNYSIFHDDTLEQYSFHALMMQLKAGEVVQTPEMWIVPASYDARFRKDEICIRTTFFPLGPPGGRFENFVLMVEDVTARATAERELAKREEELRQAQKMEAVGTIAGGLAHDFNNMLTVVKGHASICVSKTPQGVEFYDSMLTILKAVGRASHMTNQLLSFSRRHRAQPRVIDLNAAVSDATSMLLKAVDERIVIEIDPNECPYVFIDHNQLEHVLMNLVMNARDAMPEGGTITIGTHRLRPGDPVPPCLGEIPPGEYALLSVSDDGAGIPPENIPRLFEPFFTTKEKGKGTGLGLAMVFGTVKQANGFIGVESEPGAGTTFLIALPKCEGEPAVAEDFRESPLPRARGANILVIEDDTEVRDLTVYVLRTAGYTVLSASGIGEARLHADTCGRPIDLIVCDVILPIMNGPEVVALVRQAHPEAKVLYISGYTGDALLSRGLDGDGDVNLLAKPFSQEELLSAVNRALS